MVGRLDWLKIFSNSSVRRFASSRSRRFASSLSNRFIVSARPPDRDCALSGAFNRQKLNVGVFSSSSVLNDYGRAPNVACCLYFYGTTPRTGGTHPSYVLFCASVFQRKQNRGFNAVYDGFILLQIVAYFVSYLQGTHRRNKKM